MYITVATPHTLVTLLACVGGRPRRVLFSLLMQLVSCCPRAATFYTCTLNLSIGFSQTPRYRMAEVGFTKCGCFSTVIGVLSTLSLFASLRNFVFARSTGILFSFSHLTHLPASSTANYPVWARLQLLWYTVMSSTYPNHDLRPGPKRGARKRRNTTRDSSDS